MAHSFMIHNSQNGNIIYEHYCDTSTDLAAIPNQQATLGSYCTVLHGTTGVEIYISDSNNQWHLTKTARPNLQTKNITANSIVIADSGYDGLSTVNVNVPNTYTATDENKVLQNGELVAQTTRNVVVNGTYDTTLNNAIVVNVETGSGSAVLINKNITANGTYNAIDDDADGYNTIIAAVPNTYSSEDEGKVVSNNELINQSARVNEITENGIYDTTENNSVTVNVATLPTLYIINPIELTNMKNTNYPTGSSVSPTAFMPYKSIAYFQSDSVSLLTSANGNYIQISRGNNKVIQFFPMIPPEYSKLYIDVSIDGNGQSWPISTFNLVDSIGITGYYSGNWSGTTLKAYTLTNTSVSDNQAGLTVTRNSSTEVPRQIVEIDLSDITVNSYFTIFACRAYLNIYGIWAE